MHIFLIIAVWVIAILYWIIQSMRNSHKDNYKSINAKLSKTIKTLDGQYGILSMTDIRRIELDLKSLSEEVQKLSK